MNWSHVCIVGDLNKSSLFFVRRRPCFLVYHNTDKRKCAFPGDVIFYLAVLFVKVCCLYSHCVSFAVIQCGRHENIQFCFRLSQVPTWLGKAPKYSQYKHENWRICSIGWEWIASYVSVSHSFQSLREKDQEWALNIIDLIYHERAFIFCWQFLTDLTTQGKYSVFPY